MSDNASAQPVYDTRRTTVEKLEKLRELMDECARVAAREPDNKTMQLLAAIAVRGHSILDGSF